MFQSQSRVKGAPTHPSPRFIPTEHISSYRMLNRGLFPLLTSQRCCDKRNQKKLQWWRHSGSHGPQQFITCLSRVESITEISAKTPLPECAAPSDEDYEPRKSRRMITIATT
ncbi:hypothetical protein SRHO_G00152640 [Serrasalmus rhombeus]